MSTDSHDHERCVHTALSAAERLCRERCVRLTPLRRRILELIWADHCAVKAYDLLDLLRTERRFAKPASVYRTLTFLAEQGLIHRIESLNAYIGCSRDGRPHELLLLICTACGKVEERPATEVMAALEHETTRASFLPQHKALEILGLCAHCTENNKGQEPVG